jgi:hypothetical protein
VSGSLNTIVSAVKKKNFSSETSVFCNITSGSLNENHKSIAFVSNLSCLYCTQYNTTLHVLAIHDTPEDGRIAETCSVVLYCVQYRHDKLLTKAIDLWFSLKHKSNRMHQPKMKLIVCWKSVVTWEEHVGVGVAFRMIATSHMWVGCCRMLQRALPVQHRNQRALCREPRELMAGIQRNGAVWRKTWYCTYSQHNTDLCVALQSRMNATWVTYLYAAACGNTALHSRPCKFCICLHNEVDRTCSSCGS